MKIHGIRSLVEQCKVNIGVPRLLYPADEQKFREGAQWRCKTESRTLFCVSYMSERPIPVAARLYGFSLAEIVSSSPAGGMDVYFV